MGKDCNLCNGVTIRVPDNLSLGKRVSIHQYTLIAAMGEITIGNNCGISAGYALLGVNHNHTDTSIPIYNFTNEIEFENQLHMSGLVIEDEEIIKNDYLFQGIDAKNTWYIFE